MCWILRRQSYQMMQELKSFDATQPHNFRYLLYGADGSGKTICLHQVLHYCVKAGWLVVFVPGGLYYIYILCGPLISSHSLIPLVFSWTHSDRELRPSTRVPGTFDQPDTATAWLKAFRTLNSHFTSQVQLSRDWQWGKKDHSLAGEEMNKVIDMGLLKPALATDVVVALLEELVLSSGRFNIMLAVDEFNGSFSPTTLRNQQKEWVGPEQLNLIRCLLQHIPQFPGAVLLSLSRSRMLRCSAPGWTPDHLLNGGTVPNERKLESRAILDSCRAVEIPPYTRQEMERCLDYYSQRRWITTDVSQAVLNELWHLTSGCPKTLQRMCASL
ncbi:28S ribosomal protein S29, mitochondrial [Geodia barretti]|nr:28S ribosomal protein S29, mitochondrial [Geodia barretti]